MTRLRKNERVRPIVTRDPPPAMVRAAIQASLRSTCQKSKRGVAIWSPDTAPTGRIGSIGMLVEVGWNQPSMGLICTDSLACREHCGKRCEHAEAMAIRRNRKWSKRHLDLLHVKTVDGKPVPSGPPSCWQCSKQIIQDSRIDHVWLMHADSWNRYTAAVFHTLTLKNCGLTVKCS